MTKSRRSRRHRLSQLTRLRRTCIGRITISRLESKGHQGSAAGRGLLFDLGSCHSEERAGSHSAAAWRCRIQFRRSWQLMLARNVPVLRGNELYWRVRFLRLIECVCGCSGAPEGKERMRQCAGAPLPLAEAVANRSVRGAGRSTTHTSTGGSAPEPLQRFFRGRSKVYRM